MGPNCGQIVDKGVDLTVCVSANASGNCNQYSLFTGMTETNACVELGDSRGPFITPDGQAQGTL